MDRLCYDSKAICSGKFGAWGSFGVNSFWPIHRASFYILLNSNDSKNFYAMSSSRAIETVLTWRSDSTISTTFPIFSTIGLPECGASLTSNLPKRIFRNQKCAWLTVTVSGPYILLTVSALWVAFSPLAKKNCIIWCIFSSRAKTIIKIFFIINLIFLTPYSVTLAK